MLGDDNVLLRLLCVGICSSTSCTDYTDGDGNDEDKGDPEDIIVVKSHVGYGRVEEKEGMK
jgi:hypothetical protein